MRIAQQVEAANRGLLAGYLLDIFEFLYGPEAGSRMLAGYDSVAEYAVQVIPQSRRCRRSVRIDQLARRTV
ncbi:hypothetical protein D3C84_1245510 [compost metagenome]